jgi:hypothetical protein
MLQAVILGISAAAIAVGASSSAGQSSDPESLQSSQLTEKGSVMMGGRPVAYLIRRLPVSSFPQLPSPIAAILTQRGCSIPQTYQAHRPENVVGGNFEISGSSDWAVLCSEKGKVTLLVFLASDPEHPLALKTAEEKQRLQAHDLTGVMGFDWGIDSASPRQVREAQAGMEHRPPLLEHDALAETMINQRTVYHFLAKNGWTTLEVGR